MKLKILTILIFANVYISWSQSDSTLRDLASKAIQYNEKIEILKKSGEKASIDKSKVISAYLPKIAFEASYTYMDGPLEYSQEMQNLLEATQKTLIKEQAAIKTGGLPTGHPAKIEFSTPYTITNADGSTSLTPMGTLAANNVKPTPPIQVQEFFKANINAQMLLFSGLKVPYALSAAKHQIAATEHLTESETNNVIINVIATYNQLAIIDQSQMVLKQTNEALINQKKLVDKMVANGLTIAMNAQKIEIALEQLESKNIELSNARQLVLLKLVSLTNISIDSALTIKPTLNAWSLQPYLTTAANRPEIKALDEAIIATDYKRKAEISDYIPKVMAYGKKELISDNLTILDPSWYVGVGVKWTVFDGLTAKQNASQTKIDKQILSLKRDEALEMSNIKRERDWLEVQKCNQMIITSQKQLQLTQNVVHLSQRQFQEGLITFTEHLTSLNEHEKAQLDLIQQIANQRNATAEYLQSTGQLNIESL